MKDGKTGKRISTPVGSRDRSMEFTVVPVPEYQATLDSSMIRAVAMAALMEDLPPELCGNLEVEIERARESMGTQEQPTERYGITAPVAYCSCLQCQEARRERGMSPL